MTPTRRWTETGSNDGSTDQDLMVVCVVPAGFPRALHLTRRGSGAALSAGGWEAHVAAGEGAMTGIARPGGYQRALLRATTGLLWVGFRPRRDHVPAHG